MVASEREVLACCRDQPAAFACRALAFRQCAAHLYLALELLPSDLESLLAAHGRALSEPRPDTSTTRPRHVLDTSTTRGHQAHDLAGRRCLDAEPCRFLCACVCLGVGFLHDHGSASLSRRQDVSRAISVTCPRLALQALPSATSRWSTGCSTRATSRLHLGYTSATPRLHLASSRLYLGHLSFQVENLMLDTRGYVKLCDFGISQAPLPGALLAAARELSRTSP